VGSQVGLDPATRRNLELFRSLRHGGHRGSLLGVLDVTRTAMGARALRRLIGQPLRDLTEICRRQSVITALFGAPTVRAALSLALAGAGDLERLTSRVTQGAASARDFLSLEAALGAVPAVVEILAATEVPDLVTVTDAIDRCSDVRELIASAVE